MNDAKRTAARIRAYRLEGLTHRQIAAKLGLTAMAVRRRWDRAKARDTREAEEASYEAQTKAQSYKTPMPRENDCYAHLSLILEAHGTGFPVLQIDYRRAA